MGASNHGGGVALADINGNGELDLVVFHIDSPGDGNSGSYRVGWDLGANGNVTSGTSAMGIGGWWGTSTQGAGIAAYDINGNGKPDLVAFHIDHPSNGNAGYYRIGWDVKADGTVTSWATPKQVDGWWGSSNQGGGVALYDIDGNGRPELITFHLDRPDGNLGCYRVLPDMPAGGDFPASRCTP